MKDKKEKRRKLKSKITKIAYHKDKSGYMTPPTNLNNQYWQRIGFEMNGKE